MAISYPLSLPTHTGQTRLGFGGLFTVAQTLSPFTFAAQTQEYLGEIWSLDVSLPNMHRADAELWITFLMKLRGKRGTFLVGDPYAKTPMGRGTGVPTVDGAAQVGEELVTKGWTPNATDILKAGDMFQVGNRLHKALQDVDTDASGDAVIDVFPKVKESPSDNAPLILNEPKGLFRLTNNTQRFWEVYGPTSGPGGVYSLGFSALEAFDG